MTSSQPRRNHAIQSGGVPASGRVHDPALDGLRGLAILLIYIFHYGGGLKSSHLVVRLFGYLTASGWIGVELFFALSGFLITGILWDAMQQPRAPHYLRNFYARRILRIFPLYYTAIALCAVVLIATGGGFHQLRMLYILVFFLQDLPKLTEIAQQIPTLPHYHLWSLAVEEQFYLLWPFLLLIFPTRRAALRLCMAIFAFSFIFSLTVFGMTHVFSAETAHLMSSFLPTHAGGLALGGAVAIALRYPANSVERSILRRFALPAFFFGLAIYVVSSVFCHTFALTPRLQFVIGLPAVWIATAATIPLALRTGFPRRLCSIASLRFLGRISYGFYVFHLLLQPIFDRIGSHCAHAGTDLYYFIRLISAFPITLAVSWISYRFLEAPFLRLKRFFPLPSAIPANQTPETVRS